MKRVWALLMMLTLLASASAWAEDGISVDLEVREKMFLTQMTEIAINTPDYLGKTIALEGIFETFPYGESGAVFYLVYRHSPGCCGNDGITGFEVLWDDPAVTYPENNAWVRAVGVLEQYDEDGVTYMRLRLKQLTELPQRGLEFVNQ